jgi:glycosyltransferase involved in cell wall biosynthesis
MSELPLVSIVTVVKNCAQHIEETIKSVINQTYSNIEYIIIDGASTDGTVDIIKKYDDHINYWVSEPDNGISAAFNKGIGFCRGELIGLINAGDKYEVAAVKTVVDNYLYSTGDVFYSDLKIIDEKGEEKYILEAVKNVTKKTFKYRMPLVPHPTVFIKSSIYKDELFDEKYQCAMDYDFLRRLIHKNYTFKYVNEPLASMRFIGKSNIYFEQAKTESYNISVKFGDSKLISYFYNIVYMVGKYRVKKKLERYRYGRCMLYIYRRIRVLLGWSKWDQVS